MRLGTVLAQEANFYRVRLDSGGAVVLCTRRARLRKTGQSVLVGDRVEISEIDPQSDRSAIGAVLPRFSELAKPPIANCTGVLVVMALTEPPYDPALLSRFLVAVESENLKALVCLNKSDQLEAGPREAIADDIRSWGYRVVALSAHTGGGIAPLLASLDVGTYVLAGPSGAGKSSLINALGPELDLRVGSLSDRLGRGKHTTRHVELFALPGGALVADSPGFSQLEITVAPEDLDNYFPEFRPRLKDCQFRNCLHRDEPDCAVRDHSQRYRIYCEFLAEAIAHAEQQRRSADPQATIKASGGRRTIIPRLDEQYRQASRRTAKQQLHQWDETESEDEAIEEGGN